MVSILEAPPPHIFLPNNAVLSAIVCGSEARGKGNLCVACQTLGETLILSRVDYRYQWAVLAIECLACSIVTDDNSKGNLVL